MFASNERSDDTLHFKGMQKKAFMSRKMLNVNKFLPVLCCLVEDILGSVILMVEADEIRLWKIWHRKHFFLKKDDYFRSGSGRVSIKREMSAM